MKLIRTLRPTLLLAILVAVHLLARAMTRYKHPGNVVDFTGVGQSNQQGGGQLYSNPPGNFMPNGQLGNWSGQPSGNVNGYGQTSYRYQTGYNNGNNQHNNNQQYNGPPPTHISSHQSGVVPYQPPNQYVNAPMVHGMAPNGNYPPQVYSYSAPPPPPPVYVPQPPQMAYMVPMNQSTQMEPPKQYHQNNFQQAPQHQGPAQQYPVYNNLQNSNGAYYSNQQKTNGYVQQQSQAAMMPPSQSQATTANYQSAPQMLSHLNSNSQNMQEQISSPKSTTNSSSAENDSTGLFVNPALIPSKEGEVTFRNADGYEQRFKVHGQVNGKVQSTGPIVPEKISPAASVIEPSIKAEVDGKPTEVKTTSSPNVLTLSPLSSVSVDNSKFPIPSSEGTAQEHADKMPVEPLLYVQQPESVEKQTTEKIIQRKEFQEPKQHPFASSFTFDDFNFPFPTDNTLPLDAQDDYKLLMENVQNEIGKFLEKHPNLLKKVESTPQSAPPVAQRFTPSIPNLKNYVQLENQPASFYLNDKDGPVEFDLFVPMSSILELEKGIRKARFQKSSPLPAMFEKQIENTSKSVTLETDGMNIGLDTEEFEQMQELLRMGQRVTLIMYSELPPEDDGSDDEFFDAVAASPNEPSTSSSRLPPARSPRRHLPVPPPHARPSRFTNFTSNSLSTNRERATSSMVDYTSRTYQIPIHREPEIGAFNWPDDGRQPGPSNRPVPEPYPETPDDMDNTMSNTFRGHQLRTYQEIIEEREKTNKYWDWICHVHEMSHKQEEERRRNTEQHSRHRSTDPRMRLNPEHEPLQNGKKPESEMITFLIPTRVDLFAQVPFQPWRMPLIGVARRAQGVNYTPKRFLPGHKACYRRNTTETEEDSNDASINREIGPLTLEPRGYLFATPVELERLDQRYRAFMAAYERRNANRSENNDADLKKGPVLPLADESVATAFSQPLSDKEKEKKIREAADNCRTESSTWGYNGNSDDDDDEGSSHKFSGGSSFCSNQNPRFASTSSHTSGSQERQSQPTSTHTKNNERPVRDTAWKNQKKREKDAQRAIRKKEAEEQLEKQRIKKEAKAAKLVVAQEKKRIEEERLAAEKVAEEQKKKEEEEERLKNEEEFRIQKRKLMNQMSKGRKRRSKQEKYKARKVAEEKEKQRLEERLQYARSIIDPIMERELQIAKENLEKHRAMQRMEEESGSEYDEEDDADFDCEITEIDPVEQARLREEFKPTLEQLAKREDVDKSSIRDRCAAISYFFKSDPQFLQYQQKHSGPQTALHKELAKIMCAWREMEFIKSYFLEKDLYYARVARQFQYWTENIHDDLSLFINYCLTKKDPCFPTMTTMEKWIFDDESRRVETMESTL